MDRLARAVALDLFEIREMFELRSAVAFATLPADSLHWQKLEALRDEHVALLRDIDRRYHDFSNVDSRFHRLINSAGRGHRFNPCRTHHCSSMT
jgi:DNA-binding GntR family transcriptional regulator